MHFSYYKRPLLWILIVYIVLLAFLYKPAPGKSDVSHLISQKNITLTGKVVGFPTVKKQSYDVIVKVQSAAGKKASGYVYARFQDYMPAWQETVRFSGTIKKPYSIALPGNFDWGYYLALKGIFAEVAVAKAEQLVPPLWPYRFISAVRTDILTVFEQNFDRDLAAIAGGILLGERGEIEPDLYTHFQDSGAIHLLVASGGNVGFVTLMVFAFCALFGLNRKTTILAALGIAGLYTLTAGADAPLARAYFMTVCAVAGYFLRRNSGVFQGLLLSCFIILIFHPASLFETGFQMSFLATLAIVLCLNIYTLPYAWPRWIKFFVQIFLATLSTQLVLLPVFTNVFFKVSFAGLLSNMILVPLASLLMGLCFVFYIFSLLKIGFLLKTATWAILFLFQKLVQFFASLPFASVPASAWRPGCVAAYYVGLFGLFNWPQKEFRKKLYPFLIAGICLPVCIQFLLFNTPSVWLLNEWNKNAVLFIAPDGTRILNGAAIEAEKLARILRASGSGKLDALLIGEDTAKQFKQAEALKKYIKVDRILIPFTDTWPGDTMQVGKVTVQTDWGLLLNREGKLWTNRGYSGRKDSLSYILTYQDKSFTTAGNARFIVLKNGEIEDNIRNTARRLHL